MESCLLACIGAVPMSRRTSGVPEAKRMGSLSIVHPAQTGPPVPPELWRGSSRMVLPGPWCTSRVARHSRIDAEGAPLACLPAPEAKRSGVLALLKGGLVRQRVVGQLNGLTR